MRGKDELRADLQKRRQAFVKKQSSVTFKIRPEDWARLNDKIGQLSSVAGYAAFRDEPDIASLLGRLGQSRTTGLPFMDEGSEIMAFRVWSAGDTLERSPFGFRQPLTDSPLLIPEAILVPVVGYDRALNRIGHGKGHYDRALLQLPRSLKIGIAWSVQEVDAVPADPWDVPLDAVLTEREWIVR